MICVWRKISNAVLRTAVNIPNFPVSRRPYPVCVSVRCFSDGDSNYWYRGSRRRGGTDPADDRRSGSSFRPDAFEDLPEWDRYTNRPGRYRKKNSPPYLDIDDGAEVANEVRTRNWARRPREDRELVSDDSSGDEADLGREKLRGDQWELKTLGPGSSILSNLVTMAKSRRDPPETALALIEGKRFISDLMINGFVPECIFLTRSTDLLAFRTPLTGIKLYKVDFEDLKFWTNVAFNQGVIAFFKVSDFMKRAPDEAAIPLTVICDRIRNPHSLSAIMRSSAAVGCKRLILSEHCLSAWNPRVLSESGGAYRKLPFHAHEPWSKIESLIEDEAMVVLAEGADDGRNPLDTPMNQDIPSMNLYALDSWKREVVLIVGNEGHRGWTDGVTNLCRKHGGIRIHVPSTDSTLLNPALAMSVIAFEIRRRWLVQRGSHKGGLGRVEVGRVNDTDTS